MQIRRIQLAPSFILIARSIPKCIRAWNSDRLEQRSSMLISGLEDQSCIHRNSNLNKNASSIRGRSIYSAVPPQFAVYCGALCDRPTPAFAVTGNPVTVYSAGSPFFVICLRRLQRCFLWMLPPRSSYAFGFSRTDILLYQSTLRVLLLSD
jgi:hypothetical protein